MSEVPCPNGHAWPAEYRFCPTCGSPMAARIVDEGGAAASFVDVRELESQRASDLAADASEPGTWEAGRSRSGRARTVPRFEALQSRGVLTAALVLVVASAGIAGVVASEGWIWSHSHETNSVYGTLMLDDVTAAQNNCRGTGAYSDISAGTPVALRNQDGVVLSTTILSTGKETMTAGNCVFIFTLAEVPSREAKYSLEISHHTEIVKTNAQMAAANWTFSVSFGDHWPEISSP